MYKRYFKTLGQAFNYYKKNETAFGLTFTPKVTFVRSIESLGKKEKAK